jgi:hypothetical protein
MSLPPWLQNLEDDDYQFLKRFLLSSGSLKELAESYGVSYPTLRARLDRLIAKVRAADDDKLTDPFERKLRLLAADGKLPSPVAKDLLTLHRSILKERKVP